MAIVISGVNNNDKITATDGTIDLLAGVNYTGILTAPAFTASGNITAASINVGNNIQLGNAGVATATTFVGNLTGNVNATSNLLLQIGGSEKFRIASSGQLGIGGANYGTSGQVLTSGGSGSAVSWSTISGTTINSNADNRLITGSGTANTLNGESTLTYDGTTFTIGSGKNMVMYGPSGTSYSLSVEPIVSTPYGIRVKEPSTVSNGYPLIVASTNSGATLFRVLSGTGVAETRKIQPVTNNTYDLGTSSKRYANIYTQDLQLSNEAVGDNGIDGTWGNYTIVEGESDLFLKNNRSGKTYKFNLTEVS